MRTWLRRAEPVRERPRPEPTHAIRPPEAAGVGARMRFLLDEGLHPKVAELAWGLGLDAVSAHDIRRTGLSDWEQLELAAGDGRVFVTRNRWDVVHCTTELCRSGHPHAGVLLVPSVLPNDRPDAIAHALKRWAVTHEIGAGAGGFGAYHVDFLPA